MADSPSLPREDSLRRPPRREQTERLLQQMHKCVLVHHQLSCLLIHGAALQAGVYGDEGEDDVGEGDAGDGDAREPMRAVQRSIQAVGGSTARLFSKALREPKDLEAMGETLQERVNNMIRGMQGELEVADPGNTPFMDSWGLMDAAAVEAAASAATEEESNELRGDCERLIAELAAERREAEDLAAAIDLERHEALIAQRAAAEARFAEALRAENRNQALLRLVEQLEACDVDNPPDEAFLRECATRIEAASLLAGGAS